MKLHRLTDKHAVLLIGTITLISIGWILFTGLHSVIGPYDTDILRFFYPIRHFVHQEFWDGRISLWNPHLLYGLPLHAEGQIGLAYPVNLLITPLPTAFGINLHAVVHFFLAGLFFYYYLRALKLTTFAALVGAAIYMLSSAPVSRYYAGHYSMWPFLAILPGMLWCWQRYLQGGEVRWLAAASLFYGSGILAGFPQSVFYLSIYLGWMMVWTFSGKLLVARRRHKPLGAVWRKGVLFACAIAIGVGIGAIQLLPTLDYAARSFRHGATLEFVGTYSFVPEAFSTFIVPGFFGDMIRTPYWGRTNLWETWLYIGILPLALAFGVALRPRGANQWAHAVAIPVFLLLALGRFTPLLSILYHHVPGFDVFRGLSRFLLYALFSMSVLAAVAAQRLTAAPGRSHTRHTRMLALGLLACIIVLVLAVILVLGHSPLSPDSVWRRFIGFRFALGESREKVFGANFTRFQWDALFLEWWSVARFWLLRALTFASLSLLLLLGYKRLAKIPALFAAALALVILMDLYFFSAPYITTTPVDVVELSEAFLQPLRAQQTSRVFSTAAIHSHFMNARIDTTQGYAGLLSARQNSYIADVCLYDEKESLASAPVPMILNKAFLRGNVEFILMSGAVRFDPSFARPILRQDDMVLSKLADPHPRAWFADRIHRVHSLESASALLREQATVPKDSVERLADIIEIPPGGELPAFEPLALGSSERDTLREISRTPDEVILETQTSAPRLMILADTFDPDWRCSLGESQPLEIYPANVGFRAVVVPAGVHTITFRYQPASFRQGLMLSILSLLVLAGACWGVRLLRKS